MTNLQLSSADRAPSAQGELLRLERGLLAGPLIDEAIETLRDMLAPGSAAGDDIDALVDQLRAQDRARLGAIYDAFRETLIFQRVVTAPQLVAAAKAMTGAVRIHAPFQHAVFRMDLAGEAWRGFGWHQDYPYNILAAGFVTAWLPLTPSGPANGSIDVAPALSDQIHPVDIRFKRDGEGRRLATRDAFITERLQPSFDAVAEKLTLDPGDVALFDSRLVHRSGFNPGPRHRYSIQVRFGDLLAPDIVERSWRNRRTDGFDTFKTLHPDLVENEEQP